MNLSWKFVFKWIFRLLFFINIAMHRLSKLPDFYSKHFFTKIIIYKGIGIKWFCIITKWLRMYASIFSWPRNCKQIEMRRKLTDSGNARCCIMKGKSFQIPDKNPLETSWECARMSWKISIGNLTFPRPQQQIHILLLLNLRAIPFSFDVQILIPNPHMCLQLSCLRVWACPDSLPLGEFWSAAAKRFQTFQKVKVKHFTL